MTDLQIKYWQLQEATRANKAQEALKGRQVSIDEQKMDYEIDELLARIAKLKEEAKLIGTQRSQLTDKQFNENLQAITKAFSDTMKGIGAFVKSI